MKKKEMYLIPEAEVLTVFTDTCLLQASTKGFTDDPAFDNSGWGLD